MYGAIPVPPKGGSQWKSRTNIASPRNYKTAQSSVASYATANSAPLASWRMSNLRDIPESLSSSIPISKAMQELLNSIFARDEVLEPPVNEVCSCILDHFAQSGKTLKLAESEKDMFTEFVGGILAEYYFARDQSAHESDNEADWVDESEDESEGDHEHETKSSSDCDRNNKEAGRYASEGTDEVSHDNGDLDGGGDRGGDDDGGIPFSEMVDELIEALTDYRLASSGVKLFEMEGQTDRTTLRGRLVECVQEYVSREKRPLEPDPCPVFSSEWLDHLHARGILLDPKDALDWSGRGQHVEYDAKEEPDIPLVVKRVLGYSATAIVESVQCRRILLARKKVKCNRRITKEAVITEVEHLQRLEHSHIVRVVGTYTLRKDLAILLYPAAEQNLEELMDDVVELDQASPDHAIHIMPTFIGCLSNAITYIHDMNIKHMDIKPKNLLVRCIRGKRKVYIADFGIARAYKSAAESFTDTPTSFTRTYAAPEVVLQDKRGYPADIFSLGCVFMEMFSAMVSRPGFDQRERLAQIRKNDYHANVDAVLRWYRKAVWAIAPDGYDPYHMLRQKNVSEDLIKAVQEMLLSSPEERPSAHTLSQKTIDLCCSTCDDGPESFEAAEATSA